MEHELKVSCGPFGTRCNMKHKEKNILCVDCRENRLWCICKEFKGEVK